MGLCGLDGGLLQAKKLDDKYGQVGDITKVDAAPVIDALNDGYIPVVATVAQGVDAEVSYNINADTAAAKLAVALEAEKLILLTDVRGLLRDPKNEATLIPELQLSSVLPWSGGSHFWRDDPQGGMLRGVCPFRRQVGGYFGWPGGPLPADGAAHRRGHRHHADQLKAPLNGVGIWRRGIA